MASCQTTQWVSTSPYVKLTVTQSSSTATSATLSWTLQYIASSAANTSVNKSYTVKIAGSTVKTGSYNIDGKTGTNTIASGTKTITKTTSAQTISFSVSFAFNLTWSGEYQGTSSASGSISVAAKTKYTVTYNANGGSGTVSSQTKWHGTSITLYNGHTLSRTGYTFKGWATSSTGSVAYAAGATYSTNASVTLYAVWSLNTYKVTYNANGGSGSAATQTKKYGVDLTLWNGSSLSRTGYDFKGWATSSTGSVAYKGGATYSANAAITLYAVWSLKTYKVTYNANGGSGAPADQTKTYGVNLSLSTTVPTRSGYNFLGWATSASATSATYAAGATYSSNAAVTLYAVWETAYVKSTITGLSVVRCDSAGTASDSGTYARVKFSWSTYYDISAVLIYIKTVSETSYSTQIRVDVSGNSGTVTNKIIGDGALLTDTSYNIKVVVGDSGGSTSIVKTIEGTAFVIDCLAGGKGIAFGKPSELENVADFGYDTQHRGTMTFDNSKYIYGTTADGVKVAAFTPMTNTGNIHMGYGNYYRGEGTSCVYGHDTFFGVSNIATPATFRPYRRQGDYIGIVLRTAGYVTSGRTQVLFYIPMSVPVIGSPTVTLTSTSGFRLRQNGQYIFGSSAEAYALPTTFECLACYQWNYISVRAIFPADSNATNNDVVGIEWIGRITFEAM